MVNGNKTSIKVLVTITIIEDTSIDTITITVLTTSIISSHNMKTIGCAWTFLGLMDICVEIGLS